MGKLTEGQRRVLSYARKFPIRGPASGWNADVELELDEVSVDGAELQALFDLGYLDATPIPEPHEEEFDPETGSFTRSHEWRTNEAGRLALQNGSET